MIVIVVIFVIMLTLLFIATLDIEYNILGKFTNWKACPTFNAKEINKVTNKTRQKQLQKERKTLQYLIRSVAINQNYSVNYDIKYAANIKYLQDLGFTVQVNPDYALYTHKISWTDEILEDK